MRFFSRLLPVIAAGTLLISLQMAQAQQGLRGQVIRPSSSMEQPGDLGLRAHTHLLVYVPGGGTLRPAAKPSELPPVAGYFFETPASIACIYQLVPHQTPGCNPNVTIDNPSGGGGAIALVDAYDDPNAAADLAVFSKQFGLSAPHFEVVYAQGTKPALDPTGGWEVEESLDIEWAHAMAPNAKIFLVEAADNTDENLFSAAAIASDLVVQSGGGEVSMSFGGAEFAQETELDPIFATPGVVYIASVGDNPGVEYPAASPNVVAAGGTTLSRNSDTGRFLFENSWQDAGSGLSQVEPRPSFQNRIRDIVGDHRGIPDFSFDSNPNTGVWVLDTNAVPGPGWYIVGGTSVAAPSLSGIINSAGSFRASSQAENTELYKQIDNPSTTRDILYGSCGLNIGNFAGLGWDFCTGIGSDIGLRGK